MLIAVLLIPLLLENPVDTGAQKWTERLQQATARFDKQASATNLRDALDAAWRADDWQAGLRLAQIAQEKYAGNRLLAPYAARALWRGGKLLEAEDTAKRIDRDSNDLVALHTRLSFALANANFEDAAKLADRMAKQPGLSAADYATIGGARLVMGDCASLPDLARKALAAVDPSSGYPEQFVKENFDGLPEFFSAIGPERVNQTVGFGEAPLPVSNLNLPIVEAYINGKGPFRLILDTGGSLMLSLDQSVAEDLKLPKHGSALVRGVAGTSESSQSLVDELQIGPIRSRRVMTRVFEVSKSLMNSADGIIGTGIYSDARITLNFERGRFNVARSSGSKAPGVELPLRRIGDEKIITFVKVNDETVTALFDSGADAVALSDATFRRLHPEHEFLEVNAAAMGVGSGAESSLAIGPGVKLELPGHTFPTIGGLSLNVLDDTLSPMMGCHIDVLIGMPVFREMSTLTIDFPKCKMWAEWLAQ